MVALEAISKGYGGQALLTGIPVGHDRAPGQLGDRRDHSVEEIAIVGHQHDGPLVRGQKSLEPLE